MPGLADIGWAPSSITNGSFYEGSDPAADLSARVEQVRQMQMMSGQEPIPSVSGMDPKQYLQALAAQNSEVAGSLGSEFGYDLPTIMSEAAASGAYEGNTGGGGLHSLLNKTIGAEGLGQYIPEMAQLAMLAGGGLAGAAASGLYGGAAAGGSHTLTGTVAASNTAAGVAPGTQALTGLAPINLGAPMASSTALTGLAPINLATPMATMGAPAAIAGGAGAGAAAGGLGLGGWLTVGALGDQALQGNKDIVTNSSNEPPAYLQPYLSGAAGDASTLYGQGNYIAPVQHAAIDYGTNVLSGNYLNSNPYLDATFNKAAGAVTNQVQSNFGLSGRNARGIDAAGFAQEGYNDLATQIYGGNYQAERQRMQQMVPMAGQLGSYTNPGASLDDYIARLRNLGGGYGSSTSSTPTESNWLGGLAGLGLAMM